MAKMKAVLHPAEQYAHDVVAGKIVACRWVRLACERHLHDLAHGHERGLWFDRDAAERVLRFKGILKHSKGKWAGQNLVLEPWQQFKTWAMFGWMNSDGTRRFRSAYIEVARKNGKSTDSAGDGLYLAFADGEAGAEVYSAATKRDQARIVHQEAIRMVRKNPLLKKYIRIYKDNLSIEQTASKYEPLGGDSDSLDGLNVHGAVVDELHAHKSRETLELLETATGSREQPLIIMITTAGMDRQSVCYEKHEYTRKVLEGWRDDSYVDDSWFGIIYTLDEGDDWRDESVWVKSNPNLGVSKKWEDMRIKAKRAGEMAAALNNFLRRELNVWTQGEVKWMNMDSWRACGIENIPALELPEKMKGQVAYAGLDLSSTDDITAWVMVFAGDDGEYYVVCRFWIPEDNMSIRTRDQGVKYEEWVKAGFMEATPGNVIDYDWIFEQIEKDADMFDIDQGAFDRWGAARVVQVLENKGMTMLPFGQGYASMSPPMKELERLILAKKIKHGNNPVLTWMMDNVVARLDPAGNIKPDKSRSREKIDGVVALIMALDLALRHPEQKSVYESRGIRTL
ncbi:MAG: terminase large subunit [Bacteroidetes bacterium]|nr:terminase large subunit [Bacteroidota bacterium]